MKYQAGEGFRLLKKGETIPKGAHRLYTPDGPTANWVPTKAVGQVLSSVPFQGFIYRVPKPLVAAKDKGIKPGEAIMALMSDGKEHEFAEIHGHLQVVLGDKGRNEKATRVALQLLKDTGRIGASSVQYSLVEGVRG